MPRRHREGLVILAGDADTDRGSARVQANTNARALIPWVPYRGFKNHGPHRTFDWTLWWMRLYGLLSGNAAHGETEQRQRAGAESRMEAPCHPRGMQCHSGSRRVCSQLPRYHPPRKTAQMQHVPVSQPPTPNPARQLSCSTPGCLYLTFRPPVISSLEEYQNPESTST